MNKLTLCFAHLQIIYSNADLHIFERPKQFVSRRYHPQFCRYKWKILKQLFHLSAPGHVLKLFTNCNCIGWDTHEGVIMLGVTRFPFTAHVNPGTCSSWGSRAGWLLPVGNYTCYGAAQSQCPWTGSKRRILDVSWTPAVVDGNARRQTLYR